ncbi:MipA/OmpV family protein [Thalassotalea agarivorans]|uniref:Outer membrane protein n=1 Tax=Thalassotalea agarivorans TaxID=349064 RepID=A0A1H9Z7I5_THASX|nr:MipA/OmpV family protein [Thalassotalea agarivorans]SES77414.1 outer membrane protein [Thalassotalea agarivorans]
MKRVVLASISCALLSHSALAEDEKVFSEQNWGLGAAVRQASIPFATPEDKVTSFVPMLFFQGEDFYLRGIEGGYHLYENQDWQVNLFSRLRFFDIPASYQNQVHGDGWDFGVQLRRKFSYNSHLDAELLTDKDGNLYANVNNQWYFQTGSWEFMPSVGARFKSEDFNSRYFALEDITQQRIDGGVEFTGKIETRYHVASNFYLIGSFAVTSIDSAAKDARFNDQQLVDKSVHGEAYLGFAFFNDITKQRKEKLRNKGYLRIAHGFATPSNIGDIIRFDWEKDPYNNQMTSLFYGYPLTDELFSLPIDIYLQTGIGWHWKNSDLPSDTNSVQIDQHIQEYDVGIKAYYTFTWPTAWRFGVAEGFSYVSDMTYIELTEMEEKGYRPSKFINYLDFSLDVSLGDLFNVNALNDVWVGWSIHHRSAIFEQSSQYGRIKGGSNYNTLYVQFNI